MVDKIEAKINKWKEKLIDTSKRNILLNFRESKTSTIKIIDEIPGEVYNSLVIDKKAFKFLPSNLEVENINSVQFFDYKKENLPSKHTDLNLQTSIIADKLRVQLKNIEIKNKQILDDQGYNTLYISLGILEWYEADSSDKKIKAPLILVPIELFRKNVNSDYQVQFTDDEVIINPALTYKLKNEFSIEMPKISEDEESIDVKRFFENLAELIKNKKRWLITNDIFVSLFSFAKFAMYRDMESFKEIYTTNEIIKRIIGDLSLKNESISGVDIKELDEKCHPISVFQVLDSDSSQQETIEAVKAGANIVIQGPPGTGKSQTISNIIAELIAQNKRVLFVSEKMAALEVVFKRLKSANIGNHILELHSHKISKTHVYQQLKEAYESEDPGKPSNTLSIYNEIVDKRRILNSYINELHKKNDILGKTLFWVIGRLSKLNRYEALHEYSDLWLKQSYDEFKIILRIAENFRERINLIGNPLKNVFLGSNPNNISQIDIEMLSKNLSLYILNINELKDCILKLKNETIANEISVNATEEILYIFQLFKQEHNISENLFQDISKEKIEIINKVIEEIKDYRNNKSNIDETFCDSIYEFDLEQYIDLYKNKYKTWTRIFSIEYYKLNKNIIRNFKNKKKIKHFEILKLLENIYTNENVRKNIENNESKYKAIFERDWKGTESNTELFERNLNWIVNFREKYGNKFDKDFKDYIISSQNISSNINFILDKINKQILEEKRLFQEINLKMNIDLETIFKESDNRKISLESISQIFKLWIDKMDYIKDWDRYIKAYNECCKSGVKDVLDNIIYDKFEKINEIVFMIEKTFLLYWFEEIRGKSKIISEFEAFIHDRHINEFKNLDKLHIEYSKKELLKKLYDKKPNKNWNSSLNSETGILKKQFTLKRKQMGIRKLFSTIPNVIFDITPCFMMSPMSVTQFINPESIKFDVVIFDEASQITVEDSLGAIIRGKQLVVAGDSNQMPPSNFFKTSYDDEIEDDDLVDSESILDECIGAGLKECTLKWHYRSKDDSLINFSNKHIYGNKLLTFPSSNIKSENEGVSFEFIADGVYDRGGTQTNIKEAEKIVEKIVELYKTEKQISLGVIAFNSKQQRLIMDLLENEMKKDSCLEEKINASEEKMFIKNLETVQGDERDIIFISICFGKDKNGVLYANFGPINKKGGEKRLNVLITRARKQVKVFSSIKSTDFNKSISNENEEKRGAELLKKYIEYAEYGGDRDRLNRDLVINQRWMDEENPFEMAIKEKLDSLGYSYIPQVGSAGFWIDFGIVGKKDPSKFILALECDGATYHSSNTARDRDRLRQEVLEGLGWRFHRIWSTDWFQNNKREVDKLIKAINDAEEFNNSNVKKVEKLVGREHKIETIKDFTKNNKIDKVLDYKRFKPHYRRTQETFNYMMNSGLIEQELIDYALQVIDMEQPIHTKVFCDRVGEIYDFNRIGSKINHFLTTKVINNILISQKILLEKDFIYMNPFDKDFVRKRNDDNSVKEIEYISEKEIFSAIKIVFENEKSILPDELISQVANLFGFMRTGQAIKERIGGIIEDLQDKEIISNKDGRIFLDY